MPYEKHTNMQQIGKPIKAALEEFAKETGRRLHLEIEPGTYLVANAGSLVTSIVDIVQTTGAEGHEFIKVNSGMPEVRVLFFLRMWLFCFSVEALLNTNKRLVLSVTDHATSAVRRTTSARRCAPHRAVG